MKRTCVLTVMALVCGCLFLSFSGCSSLRLAGAYLGLWERGEVREVTRGRIEAPAVPEAVPQKENPDLYYQVGHGYWEKGMYVEALAEFRKAVEINPRHVDAHNGMGVCYDKLMDYENAVNAYQSALQLDGGAHFVHGNMGRSFLLQGKHEMALKAFRTALGLSPGNQNYLAGIVKVCDTLGQSLCKAAGVTMEIASAAPGKSSPNAPSAVLSVKPPAPAIQPKETSNAAGQGTGIEISNGNGRNRFARSMAKDLRSKGLNVIRCTNGPHFDHLKSTLYYVKGSEKAAEELLHEVPGVRTKEVVRLWPQAVRVQLLAGKDLLSWGSHN